MNLNASQRFAQVPVNLDIQRSRFDRSFDFKCTANTGELFPCYLEEVLPGDTFDVETQVLCRMATPLFPVMDSAWLDVMFFFVPNRLLWDHWEAFNGQNDDTYWTQPVEYNVPRLRVPADGWDKGSLADYFGIPTDVGIGYLTEYTDDSMYVNALPFRGYCKIWNDWFRDQNYMNPAYFTKDDSDRVGRRRDGKDDVPASAIEDALYGGRPLQVAKFHDYFTSVLPQPQKGEPVGISVSGNSFAPVGTYSTFPGFADGAGRVYPNSELSFNVEGLRMGIPDLGEDNTLSGVYPLGFAGANSDYSEGVLYADTGIESDDDPSEQSDLVPLNLAANFNGVGLNILVSDVRLAFQLQKLFEADARGGSRYIEILHTHFGVQSPDGRLQRSEFLGSSRTPIVISQVLQQSGTPSSGDGSPLGSTGAYSLTTMRSNSFIKSFTEHGYIIGVACVRTEQSYQEGLNRLWSRRRRFDFYWPVLANISEQPVFRKEILFHTPYDDGVSEFVDTNNEVFGYQEAWADYRYHPNMITGAFRSNYQGSLDAWHYGSDFGDADPNTFVADETFMYETAANVDRTLAVQSELEDQFIIDFHFNNWATRPMPMFSVPGLVDHH